MGIEDKFSKDDLGKAGSREDYSSRNKIEEKFNSVKEYGKDIYSGLGNRLNLNNLSKNVGKNLATLGAAGIIAFSSFACTHTDAFTTTGFLVGGPVGAVAGYYVGKDLDKEQAARQNVPKKIYEKCIFNNLNTNEIDEIICISGEDSRKKINDYFYKEVEEGYPEEGIRMIGIYLDNNQVNYDSIVYYENNEWRYENLLDG